MACYTRIIYCRPCCNLYITTATLPDAKHTFLSAVTSNIRTTLTLTRHTRYDQQRTRPDHDDVSWSDDRLNRAHVKTEHFNSAAACDEQSKTPGRSTYRAMHRQRVVNACGSRNTETTKCTKIKISNMLKKRDTDTRQRNVATSNTTTKN